MAGDAGVTAVRHTVKLEVFISRASLELLASSDASSVLSYLKILTQSYTYWFTLTLGVALKRGYNLTLTPLPTEHATPSGTVSATGAPRLTPRHTCSTRGMREHPSALRSSAWHEPRAGELAPLALPTSSGIILLRLAAVARRRRGCSRYLPSRDVVDRHEQQLGGLRTRSSARHLDRRKGASE